MIYNDDFLFFRVLTINRFFHKEGIFDVNGRPFASLSFRISGSSTVEADGKTLTTEPGDVLFIPADTPYRVEYSFSEIIVIHFEQCNHFEAESIGLENKAAIENRFRHLLEVWNERHSMNQAKSVIYDILEKIASEKELMAEHTLFSECVRYINEHFCDPELSIETVCREKFISASGLQRAFRNRLGVSPKQYIDKLRMSRSLELLTDAFLSVKEIAFACGFKDEKYFSRAFKNKYGHPPSQFRKNLCI